MGEGIKDTFLGRAIPLNSSVGNVIKDNFLGRSVPLVKTGTPPEPVTDNNVLFFSCNF